MTAYASYNQSSNCCTAAACSSAPVSVILDTAINLAVSIIISAICIIDIRLRIGGLA